MKPAICGVCGTPAVQSSTRDWVTFSDYKSLENEEIGSLQVVDIAKDAVSVMKCGRGEWIAKTLKEAKQMAIDFNEGVS